MILLDSTRVTEENHVPVFVAYPVDRSLFCQCHRPPPAATATPQVDRHHRDCHLWDHLWLQDLGGDRHLRTAEESLVADVPGTAQWYSLHRYLPATVYPHQAGGFPGVLSQLDASPGRNLGCQTNCHRRQDAATVA